MSHASSSRSDDRCSSTPRQPDRTDRDGKSLSFSLPTEKGRKVARSGERDHLCVQIRFSLKADARKLGQCHVPINDFNAVGKTAIGLEQLHNYPRHAMSSSGDRALRCGAIIVWREIAEPGIAA
jgi:hypothetical protein